MAGEVAFVFGGGVIRTLDSRRPRVEALSIRDGEIVALGSMADAWAAVPSDAREVDLEGRTLMPAFTDSHLHLLGIGWSLLHEARGTVRWLELGDATSAVDVGNRVREVAERLAPGEWILGRGWDQTEWGEAHMPTHAPLTASAPDNPVILARIDGHAAWVNAAALAAAGIDASSADPDGGVILRHHEGTPTGVLLDRACEPVLAQVPPPTDEDVREAMALAVDGLAAAGITRACDAGLMDPPGLISLAADQVRYVSRIAALDRARPLPIDLSIMAIAPSPLADALLDDPSWSHPSPSVRLGHHKFFIDGALGSWGARMSSHYRDSPETAGLWRCAPDDFRGLARRTIEAGLDVAAHAIGSEATRGVLEAYADLARELGVRDAHRLRVEHATCLSEEDVRRAADLGCLLVVQPDLAAPTPHDGRPSMQQSRLGADYAERVYLFAELMRNGAHLVGSSDAAAVLPEPLTEAYAAATRRNPERTSVPPRHPEEAVPRDVALRLVTDWQPAGAEPLVEGRLGVGQPAELVELSADPLEGPEERLLELQIGATWHRGRCVFREG